MESEWSNCSRKECIRRKTRLVGLFLLLKFHQPSTTPLLSPKTLKHPLGPPTRGIVLMRNSNPSASAQPMSRRPSSDCHPGMRRQARHLPPITMAMPMPELASEKACMSEMGRGAGMGLASTEESLRAHHARSSDTPLTGKYKPKGWEPQMLNIASSPVR